MKKVLVIGLLISLSFSKICCAQIIDLSKQNLKIGIGFSDSYMDKPYLKKA